jgi:uncharacterized membrane protein
MNKSKILLLVHIGFLLISFAITAAVFEQLPRIVPMHWNIRGEADGFGSRGTVWISPVINLLMFGLFQGLTYAIAKDEKQKNALMLLGVSLSGFFLLLQILILAASLKYQVDMTRWMGLGLCVMFMMMGGAMKDLPRNGLAGIRLPWTMKSDEAWAVSHHRAAKIMIYGSVAGFWISLFVNGFAGIMICLLAMLYTIPDSYYATRKLS